MPLLLEDDAKGVAGFDLSTATTLFWKPVPVFIKQQEREDQYEELTFRILNGVARQNHNLRILRVHISSENDLNFLHTLEVSEEEFQSLKNDQGILVDFASFPGKIISLLEKCTTAQPTDSPRFQAVLTVRGNDSIFKILEINDFKQLPHITLAFRPGNDTVVKQFLAFRLMEVKGNFANASEELQRTKDERDGNGAQLAHCRQQLAELREQYDKHLLEVQAHSKTQQATAHEERLREKAQLKDQHEKERSDLERRFREQAGALNARITELDAENRRLRETKYELDTKVSELSHKLGSCEGANRSLEEESTRIKALNQQLNAAKHDSDIQLNEAKAKVLSLEEKAQSQAEVIEQQRGRLKDLETAMRQLESRCNDMREVAGSADVRAKEAQAEVLKGNQIIEKLTSDLRLNKEKTKRKAAIMVRQEEELQQREQALAQVSRELQVLSQQAEGLRGEVASLRSENAELKGKLEDSKQQLQSNEQMIRWLNQQVTEAQLNVSGSAPGSRYSFRPAIMSGTAGGGGPSVSATPAMGLLAAGPSSTTGGVSSLYTSKYASHSSGALTGSVHAPLSSSLAGGDGAGHGPSSTFKSFSSISPAGLGSMPTPGMPGAGGAGGSTGYSGLAGMAATPAPGRSAYGTGGMAATGTGTGAGYSART